MGMAFQIMIGLGIFCFLGFKLDKYLKSNPLLIITLPLLFIISLFYKIIKDTSKN
jgi:F0F1-type ATP synthase assembly protein I